MRLFKDSGKVGVIVYIDWTVLVAGLAIVVGGVMLLANRRRKGPS